MATTKIPPAPVYWASAFSGAVAFALGLGIGVHLSGPTTTTPKPISFQQATIERLDRHGTYIQKLQDDVTQLQDAACSSYGEGWKFSRYHGMDGEYGVECVHDSHESKPLLGTPPAATGSIGTPFGLDCTVQSCFNGVCKCENSQ